ncbi:MAG: c-type cytochrome domain-containing protein [Bacteroidia bacterium]
MKNIIFLSFSFFLVLAFYSSCKHEPTQIYTGNQTDTTGNNNGGNNNNPPKSDSVCFNTQVLPLIMNNCAMSGCHDNITRAEGLNLTTYTGIRAIVTPYNTNSKLIREIKRTDSERMPPPPMAAMDTASINLLKKWISQGATNKICIDDCDTSSVKYSSHIAPLVNTYCKGCHQTSNAGGGIVLENLSQVQTQVQNGKFLCSIKWTGCSNMPKGGSKFSNCNIRKFEIWQNSGFPQ